MDLIKPDTFEYTINFGLMELITYIYIYISVSRIDI